MPLRNPHWHRNPSDPPTSYAHTSTRSMRATTSERGISVARTLAARTKSFVAGFADTTSDTVSVTSTRSNVVSVTLDADQSDGTTRHYVGTYTVNGGVITAAHVVRR